METDALMHFNLTKFVFGLDFFSLGLLIILLAVVTWLLSLLMSLRFEVGLALSETTEMLQRMKKLQVFSEVVPSLQAPSFLGFGQIFFDALTEECGVSLRGKGFDGTGHLSGRFFQKSVFAARDSAIDVLCARVERASLVGWGVGLLSLCAVLIRSLMLVAIHGGIAVESAGIDGWLFGTLLYALLGVWGICVTTWICGFLKITLASIDQQLKRVCWRIVFLSERQ